MEMTRSVYKQIMLAEIVESRLYKNTDIKQLVSGTGRTLYRDVKQLCGKQVKRQGGQARQQVAQAAPKH